MQLRTIEWTEGETTLAILLHATAIECIKTDIGNPITYN